MGSIFDHTPGTWRRSDKVGGTIISDCGQGLAPMDQESFDFYGGHVIAETVAECNIPLIALAPMLLRKNEELKDRLRQAQDERGVICEWCKQFVSFKGRPVEEVEKYIKDHSKVCPESPLVKEIADLKREVDRLENQEVGGARVSIDHQIDKDLQAEIGVSEAENDNIQLLVCRLASFCQSERERAKGLEAWMNIGRHLLESDGFRRQFPVTTKRIEAALAAAPAVKQGWPEKVRDEVDAIYETDTPAACPRITYTSEPDNEDEVKAFIGPTPPCPQCGGYGEYETGHGPRGCQPCNSRCIAYIDFEGKRRYLDWGETLERRKDGLHKVEIGE
jgi:hypothetical protein